MGEHSNDILGSGHVDDPDACYGGVTQELADAMVERVAQAFPTLSDMTYRGGWAGMYPHSPDGQLVAGPHPENPDVLVGSGLGGAGLVAGQTLGAILADWIIHGEPRIADAGNLVPRAAVIAPVSD